MAVLEAKAKDQEEMKVSEIEEESIDDLPGVEVIASTQESSMMMEQIQEKNDEIERLMDLLEKEKAALIEANK
jgi:hypothetical protein